MPMGTAIDITPLLRTKGNWPSLWEGYIVGDTGDWFTVAIHVDKTRVGAIMAFSDGTCDVVLADWPDSEAVKANDFDIAIEVLVKRANV